MNKKHDFKIILIVDGKTVASRQNSVTEYNDNVIYSLRLNELMKEMCGLIDVALKDKSIAGIDRMLKRGIF